MYAQFHDALNVYLFPFLLALPIALVLWLLVSRRDEPPPQEQRPPAADPAEPAARVAAPPAVAAVPAPAPAAAPAPLPVARAPAPALAAQPPAGEPVADLLLVDDSAVARAKLRKLFEGAGYRVALAKDGVEALELLGQGRYLLMLTDLEMPNMDGVELIAAVAGSLDTEDMPILAITGHDDLQAKVHECQGLYGIFKKPWNDRDLLRRVESLVRSRRGAAQPALAEPA